jgi:limonene-1,2-epoxide hydrolase
MTNASEQAVFDFMDCWHRFDLEDAVSRLADDARFRPDPAADETVGREALRALWGTYMQALSSYDMDVVHIVGRDGVVFLERVEHFSTPDGRRITLPLIGVYELDGDGRITRWQDYWDPKMSPPPLAGT